MNEGSEPLRVLAGLQASGVRGVVVGGLAAFVHGAASSTDDVDICVEGTDDNLERLSLLLQRLGAAMSPQAGDDHRATFTTIAGPVDIFELSVEEFAPLDERATTVDIGRGIKVRVASIEDLVGLKKESGDLAGSVRMAALSEAPADAAASVPDPAKVAVKRGAKAPAKAAASASPAKTRGRRSERREVRQEARQEARSVAKPDETDELSRPEEAPTKVRDRVWRALENVDAFMTKLVEG
jgi:hypothetical protein